MPSRRLPEQRHSANGCSEPLTEYSVEETRASVVIAAGVPPRMFRNVYSGSASMNPMSSYPDHENRSSGGSLHQGSSRGTAGQFSVFLEKSVIDPPRGRTVRCGGIVHNRGLGRLKAYNSA